MAIGPTHWAMLWPLLAGLVGLASAAFCLRRRQWVDAAAVTVAAAALVLLLTGWQRPAGSGAMLRIEGAELPDSVLEAAPGAAGVALVGDGLRAADWRDLPARPLQWTPPTAPTLALDFPRSLPLGRRFELALRRSVPLAAWRLQLQDENGRLLAETAAAGTEAKVTWLPPFEGQLLLQARVLDAEGTLLAHGPVPLQVLPAVPLQVMGRFGAPSFDVQALSSLLVGSQAVLDWQVTLGKGLTRQETARVPMEAPDLIVVDAAHVERAAPADRRALMARVAQGTPLLVLPANAADAALWAREFELPLVAQTGDPPRSIAVGAGLELPATVLAPAAAGVPVAASAETSAERSDSAGSWRPWGPAAAPWAWQRSWQAGRIVWLGVSDWHRAAVASPRALGDWWQDVLDRSGVMQPRALEWHFPEPLPVAGERTVVCLRGSGAARAVRVLGLPNALPAPLHLQRRADSTDAACAALWPQQAGWLELKGDDPAVPSGHLYVHASADWPAWQAGLRRDASAGYAARTPAPALAAGHPGPAWPAAALFAVALLLLCWRERRSG